MNKLIIAIAVAALSSGAAAQNMSMKRDGPIDWICGGVGSDERAELKKLEKQANAMLVFVTAQRGGYVADVDFSIRDPKDGKPVLRARSDGPTCLLHLPPGQYTVDAAYAGSKRSAKLTVPKQTGRPARVVLSFPADPSDDIKASPEEKAAAKS
jgi:hypothetical protein